MKLNVWSLWFGNRKNLGLIPHDLDYFQTHFVAQPMSRNWRPPPVTIDGKTKRLSDFVSWMVQAPVCSQRAKEALEPAIGQDVEFLPLVELRGKQYFAVNVLRLVDCLDRDRSDILYSPHDPGKILSISTYAFRQNADFEGFPIFMIPDDRSLVFATRPLIDVVIAQKLTGVAFCDPGVNHLRDVMRGETGNVVPGIPE